MSTYASVDDFKGFTTMEPMPSDGRIQLALDKAERDVDRFLAGPVDPTTGLRVDVTQLPTWQLQHLVNATCAQAEYRLEMGDEFFALVNNDEVIQGPDFTISGRRRRFSIVAAEELKGGNLLLLSARAVP